MKFIGRDPLLRPVSADELSDVDLSGLASGDLLEFDGNDFVALTPGSGSGLDADTVDGSEASDFATSAQGSLADTSLQPGDDADALGSGSANSGTFLGADGSGGASWTNLPNVESLGNAGVTAGYVLQADGDGTSSFSNTFSGEMIFESQIRTSLATYMPTTGTLILDFSDNSLLTTQALTGNITFTTSNLAAGRTVTVRVVNGATDRDLTFPAGWTFVGPEPSDIAASKTGVLTATAFGASDSDVIAAWAAEE